MRLILLLSLIFLVGCSIETTGEAYTIEFLADGKEAHVSLSDQIFFEEDPLEFSTGRHTAWVKVRNERAFDKTKSYFLRYSFEGESYRLLAGESHEQERISFFPRTKEVSFEIVACGEGKLTADLYFYNSNTRQEELVQTVSQDLKTSCS